MSSKGLQYSKEIKTYANKPLQMKVNKSLWKSRRQFLKKSY